MYRDARSEPLPPQVTLSIDPPFPPQVSHVVFERTKRGMAKKEKLLAF